MSVWPPLAASRLDALTPRINPGVCALRFLDQRLIRQYKSEQTVGDILDRTGSFDRGPFYVAGTPAVVADAIEAWLDRAGIDGINLRQFLTPGTAEDFIELVVFPNCAAAVGTNFSNICRLVLLIPESPFSVWTPAAVGTKIAEALLEAAPMGWYSQSP